MCQICFLFDWSTALSQEWDFSEMLDYHTIFNTQLSSLSDNVSSCGMFLTSIFWPQKVVWLVLSTIVHEWQQSVGCPFPRNIPIWWVFSLFCCCFWPKSRWGHRGVWRRNYEFHCSQFLVVDPSGMNFACPKICVFVLQINIFMGECLHCTVGQLKNMFPKYHKSPIISKCSG